MKIPTEKEIVAWKDLRAIRKQNHYIYPGARQHKSVITSKKHEQLNQNTQCSAYLENWSKINIKYGTVLSSLRKAHQGWTYLEWQESFALYIFVGRSKIIVWFKIHLLMMILSCCERIAGLIYHHTQLYTVSQKFDLCMFPIIIMEWKKVSICDSSPLLSMPYATWSDIDHMALAYWSKEIGSLMSFAIFASWG